MKILIFSDRANGGAGNVATAQSKELSRQGGEVRLLTAESLPDYSERFRNWRMLWNLAGIRLVRKTLIEFKPDIVHCHNIHEKFSFAVLMLAKQSGAKIFLTAHDTYLFYPAKSLGDRACLSARQVTKWQELHRFRFRYNPFRNFVAKHYLKYVDRVFAVSDALGQALREHGIENTTLHNGIDVSRWLVDEAKVSEFKTRYNLVGKRVILWVGRLSGAKGGAVLPNIMREVSDKIPNVHLFAIGGETRLKNDEMPFAYAAADVVIVPSVYLDPFPTVVLEAGASGRPVVVTNMGGAKEAVVEGETGYVADPCSSDFAERVIELLRNPEQARAIGEKARGHIAQNFSLKRQMQVLSSWYNQL